MASMDYYFADETSNLLTKTPAYILDEARAHLASAIAALLRAGKIFLVVLLLPTRQGNSRLL